MKRLILSFLASGLCAGAMAIPAKPGPVEFIQPDGSVINVIIKGDEHGHMLFSKDGMLLVEENGYLEYARFNSEGFPVSSGVRVTSADGVSVMKMQLQSQSNIDGWADRLNEVRNARIANLQEITSLQKSLTRGEESDVAEGESGLVPKYFGRCDSDFPVEGEQKALVILVEYEDVPFEFGSYDYFHRMLNEEGFSDYGSLGSARDWFVENSGGKFLPDFDVYGPVKLPNNRQYYGGNDVYGNDLRPHEMAIHACQLLDDEVDFSQYDRDGDGVIDNAFIFYAGKGEHDSGIKNAVWPHSWDVASGSPNQKFIFDGVRLNHYACTCEYPSGYKRPDGIGTFVHEFSHVIGLPDLYNTVNDNVEYTPKEWSVMDSGPYNNNRLTPPNYSSYEKVALGWIDFKPFEEGKMEIHDLSTTNEAYAQPTDKATEFYFFENRQNVGNDKFLPGHGMLVWHIDFKGAVWAANTVNNLMGHQYVDLIEADNFSTSGTRAADSFPGKKGVTSFGFETLPKLASWSGARLAFDLKDIAEQDGVISFNAVRSGDDNAVGEIEAISPEDGVYYDLMGRRVTNPGNGLYIRDGKKVLIKD